MVLLIGVWLLIVGSSSLIGHALLNILIRNSLILNGWDRFFISFWLGIIIIANTLLGLSIFHALNPEIALIAAAIMVCISLLSLRHVSWTTVLKNLKEGTVILEILILTLAVGLYSSQDPAYYDIGLYHLQVIKWLAEYGSVPGLALLHSRFGFTSSWFSLVAPFNHGIFSARLMAMSGGLAFLLLLLHLCSLTRRIFSGQARLADFFLFVSSMIVIPFVVFKGLAGSPSPDLPVIILSLLACWLILIIAEQKSMGTANDSGVDLVPVLLALGAATMKLSAIIIAAVAICFYLFSRSFSVKKMLKTALVVLIMLAPFWGAAVMTSGYLAYPSTSISFDVPWRLQPEDVNRVAEEIRDFARWGGTVPDYGNRFNWLMPWLKREKFAAALIIISIFALPVVLKEAFRKSAYLYVILAGICGTVFVMLTGPTVRFGIGNFVIIPSLGGALLLNKHFNGIPQMPRLFRKYPVSTLLVLGLSLCLLGQAVFLPRLLSRELSKEATMKRLGSYEYKTFHFLLPPKVINRSTMSVNDECVTYPLELIKERCNDIVYYRPAIGDQTWDSPLPAVPLPLVNVTLRDPRRGFAGGFILAQ